MAKNILLVSNDGKARSAMALKKILLTIGLPRLVSESRVAGELDDKTFDLMVIDDGSASRTLALLADVRRRACRISVVVVKDDVTWQEVRDLLRAGVSDVIAEAPWTVLGVAQLESTARLLLSK